MARMDDEIAGEIQGLYRALLPIDLHAPGLGGIGHTKPPEFEKKLESMLQTFNTEAFQTMLLNTLNFTQVYQSDIDYYYLVTSIVEYILEQIEMNNDPERYLGFMRQLDTINTNSKDRTVLSYSDFLLHACANKNTSIDTLIHLLQLPGINSENRKLCFAAIIYSDDSSQQNKLGKRAKTDILLKAKSLLSPEEYQKFEIELDSLFGKSLDELTDRMLFHRNIDTPGIAITLFESMTNIKKARQAMRQKIEMLTPEELNEILLKYDSLSPSQALYEIEMEISEKLVTEIAAKCRRSMINYSFICIGLLSPALLLVPPPPAGIVVAMVVALPIAYAIGKIKSRRFKTTLHSMYEQHETDIGKALINRMQKPVFFESESNLIERISKKTSSSEFSISIASSFIDTLSESFIGSVKDIFTGLKDFFFGSMDTHNKLTQYKKNPIYALISANEISVEGNSIASVDRNNRLLNFFGADYLQRDLITQFVADNLEQIENRINKCSPISLAGDTKGSRRGLVYLTESTKVQRALNSLYCSEPAMQTLLAEIKQECEEAEIHRRFNLYYEKNKIRLGLSNVGCNSYEDLPEDQYELIYLDFLKDEVIKDTHKTVMSSGLNSTIILAGLLGVGLAFTPAAPAIPFIVPALAAVMFCIGYLIIRHAARREEQIIRNNLNTKIDPHDKDVRDTLSKLIKKHSRVKTIGVADKANSLMVSSYQNHKEISIVDLENNPRPKHTNNNGSMNNPVDKPRL